MVSVEEMNPYAAPESDFLSSDSGMGRIYKGLRIHWDPHSKTLSFAGRSEKIEALATDLEALISPDKLAVTAAAPRWGRAQSEFSMTSGEVCRALAGRTPQAIALPLAFFDATTSRNAMCWRGMADSSINIADVDFDTMTAKLTESDGTKTGMSITVPGIHARKKPLWAQDSPNAWHAALALRLKELLKDEAKHVEMQLHASSDSRCAVVCNSEKARSILAGSGLDFVHQPLTKGLLLNNSLVEYHPGYCTIGQRGLEAASEKLQTCIQEAQRATEGDGKHQLHHAAARNDEIVVGTRK